MEGLDWRLLRFGVEWDERTELCVLRVPYALVY